MLSSGFCVTKKHVSDHHHAGHRWTCAVWWGIRCNRSLHLKHPCPLLSQPQSSLTEQTWDGTCEQSGSDLQPVLTKIMWREVNLSVLEDEMCTFLHICEFPCKITVQKLKQLTESGGLQPWKSALLHVPRPSPTLPLYSDFSNCIKTMFNTIICSLSANVAIFSNS